MMGTFAWLQAACEINGGGGAGTAAVLQGQGALPGGGGAPRAFASAVQRATAGLAFAGTPDLAVVPVNEPFGKLFGLVAGCIASTMKRANKQGDADNSGLWAEIATVTCDEYACICC